MFNDEQHLYGDMDIDGGSSTLGSRHGKIIRGYSDGHQDIRPASQLKEREV